MHLRIVDAIGVGTFSVDADELERLRRAEVVSFEGRRQTPASIFVIPFETASPVELDIHASGTIDVSFAEGCIDEANSITCSPRAELIRAGDAVVFDISFGNFAGEPTGDLASNVENYMRTGDAALIDAFLESTAETTQTELQALSPYVPPRVFARILNILIYEKLVRYYEARFSLREKQATLGMWTNPFVDRPISDHCFADMREACESVEEHIRGFEGSVLERLRRDGYTIYLKTDVTLDDQGAAEPLARRRPHFSLFDGLFLELSPARPEGTALDYQAEYEQAIRDIAADAGPSMPIHLTPWAGPMRFYLSGDQCENTICPSAFSDYFAFNEQILKTALEAFTPSQFAGFGIPLFDALTFDFRNPAPAIYGARTNRAAETLANNPLLNVYLTR